MDSLFDLGQPLLLAHAPGFAALAPLLTSTIVSIHLLPSAVVSVYLPYSSPCRPSFRLPSLLPSFSLPSPFLTFLPSRNAALPSPASLPCLPSPAVSRLPSLSAPAPRASASAFILRLRLPCRPSGSDSSRSAQLLPRSGSLLSRSTDLVDWLPTVDMLSTVECMFEYVFEYAVDKSGIIMEFADVCDVYVDLVEMNAKEDNENIHNLGGQNLEGDNLGGEDWVE
ncbi:hypothetical protein ACLOJK_015336 [Asimina triloba]